MTVSNDTPQRVTLVAVDIAKNSHDVLIESPNRGRRRRLRLANNLEDFEQLAGYLRRARTTSNMDGRMLQPARSAKIAAALRGLVTRLLSKEHASGVWSRGQRRIIKFRVANNLRAHMNALVGKGMTTLLNPRVRPFSLYGQSAVR